MNIGPMIERVAAAAVAPNKLFHVSPAKTAAHLKKLFDLKKLLPRVKLKGVGGKWGSARSALSSNPEMVYFFGSLDKKGFGPSDVHGASKIGVSIIFSPTRVPASKLYPDEDILGKLASPALLTKFGITSTSVGDMQSVPWSKKGPLQIALRALWSKSLRLRNAVCIRGEVQVTPVYFMVSSDITARSSKLQKAEKKSRVPATREMLDEILRAVKGEVSDTGWVLSTESRWTGEGRGGKFIRLKSYEHKTRVGRYLVSENINRTWDVFFVPTGKYTRKPLAMSLPSFVAGRNIAESRMAKAKK